MMQLADHREGDDLPPIGGLALAEFGGVLVERELALRLEARSGGREQGVQQVKHWGRLAGPQARKHQRLCGRRGSEEAQRAVNNLVRNNL